MEREEAIDIVKDTITYNIKSPRVREALEILIPELENNDENLRKTLIKLFTEDPGQQYGGYTKEKILAWLEKQGENEHTWSKEDEKMIDDIRDEIYPYGECPDYPTDEERDYYYNHKKMVDWLDALKSQSK